MTEPIPQPTPIRPAAPPAAAPAAARSSDLMLVRFSGYEEVAVVCKRSYRWSHGQPPRRADSDAALREQPELWPEPFDGRGPSCRTLVDAHAWRSGTDLLVRGTARTPRPLGRLDLAIAAAGRTVAGVAWGARRLERRGSAWAFSEPEPFTELPLRAELAYGGSDAEVEQRIIAQALADMGPAKARRAGPSMEGILRGNRPLAYPRNPHGLGYVLEDRPALAGRELPRLERADDLLTPQRLVLPAPWGWLDQPLPLLWGGMALEFFPRIAMAGAPPPGYVPGDACPEVARGLLREGFCHGNVHSTEPADLPRLVDPAVTGNADLALRFTALAPGSRIELRGFDAAGAGLTTAVPTDHVQAELPDPGGASAPVRCALSLSELSIDSEAGTMDAVFTGRLRVQRPVQPARLAVLRAALRIIDGGR